MNERDNYFSELVKRATDLVRRYEAEQRNPSGRFLTGKERDSPVYRAMKELQRRSRVPPEILNQPMTI